MFTNATAKSETDVELSAAVVSPSLPVGEDEIPSEKSFFNQVHHDETEDAQQRQTSEIQSPLHSELQQQLMKLDMIQCLWRGFSPPSSPVGERMVLPPLVQYRLRYYRQHGTFPTEQEEVAAQIRDERMQPEMAYDDQSQHGTLRRQDSLLEAQAIASPEPRDPHPIQWRRGVGLALASLLILPLLSVATICAWAVSAIFPAPTRIVNTWWQAYGGWWRAGAGQAPAYPDPRNSAMPDRRIDHGVVALGKYNGASQPPLSPRSDDDICARSSCVEVFEDTSSSNDFSRHTAAAGSSTRASHFPVASLEPRRARMVTFSPSTKTSNAVTPTASSILDGDQALEGRDMSLTAKV